jgi:polar amino acid transport system permease protein
VGYDWDFSAFWPYAWAFVRGLLVTVELSVLASVAGTVLGILLGPALRVRGISWWLVSLNDILRAVPLLVLIFLFYYFPYRPMLGIDPPSPFVASFLALTLAQTVFTADLVRAAIDGVSQQAILGARALGLRESTIWWHIVLPDVMRQIAPAMVAFYIGNVKLSSLASVIGCQEIVFTARVAMGQTYRSLEAWLIVAAIYIILVLPSAWAARRLERSEWLKRRT